MAGKLIHIKIYVAAGEEDYKFGGEDCFEADCQLHGQRCLCYPIRKNIIIHEIRRYKLPKYSKKTETWSETESSSEELFEPTWRDYVGGHTDYGGEEDFRRAQASYNRYRCRHEQKENTAPRLENYLNEGDSSIEETELAHFVRDVRRYQKNYPKLSWPHKSKCPEKYRQAPWPHKYPEPPSEANKKEKEQYRKLLSKYRRGKN